MTDQHHVYTYEKENEKLKKENEKLKACIKDFYDWLDIENEGVGNEEYKLAEMARACVKELGEK